MMTRVASNIHSTRNRAEIYHVNARSFAWWAAASHIWCISATVQAVWSVIIGCMQRQIAVNNVLYCAVRVARNGWLIA